MLIHYYVCRYAARAVLVPFAHHAPALSTDNLDRILKEAPQALPQPLRLHVTCVIIIHLNNVTSVYRLAAFLTELMETCQLIQEAQLPGVTPGGLWDHFTAVSVPAIKLWQATQEEETSASTCAHQDVAMEYAQHCHEGRRNSEVQLRVMLFYRVTIIFFTPPHTPMMTHL